MTDDDSDAGGRSPASAQPFQTNKTPLRPHNPISKQKNPKELFKYNSLIARCIR